MELPTPKEIADELLNNAFLTKDQANTIAAEVYQPLKEKIGCINYVLTRLIAWSVTDLGEDAARVLLNDLNS